VEALNAKQIDANTVFWLERLSQGMGEKANVDFNANNGNGAIMTPNEAQEKIDEMLSNAQHPYHQGVTSARKRMQELIALANPDVTYTTSFA